MKKVVTLILALGIGLFVLFYSQASSPLSSSQTEWKLIDKVDLSDDKNEDGVDGEELSDEEAEEAMNNGFEQFIQNNKTPFSKTIETVE